MPIDVGTKRGEACLSLFCQLLRKLYVAFPSLFRPRITPESEMTVLNRRSRMISVRLSEAEYADLVLLCSVTGARSVSDLTRDAMRALLSGANREEAVSVPMGEFRAQMKSLDRKIEQLAADITNLKANGSR